MIEAPIVRITDIAFGGKGVARTEGKVVFVPFVIPDEVAVVRLKRQKKKFAEGDLVSVVDPSPDRVDAPCPYFRTCGGCAYQHIRYERQLEIKASQVEQTLRRVGKFEEVPMRPIIPSPLPYEYRNRIRVHRAGPVTGFYAQDGRTIVDVERCLLAEPVVNEQLARLRKSRAPEGDYSLRAPGGAGPFFEQVNRVMAREMVALVQQTVTPGRSLIVDAYCGGGFFAHTLAAQAEQVIGIEENAAAIEYARAHAAPNESYVLGDVAYHLGEILGAAKDLSRTTVLLDPPNTGLETRVTDFLLGNPPAEIVYVSCNPATLARDLAALRSSYRLVAVTPLDLFPQTAEIEVIVHLARISA